MTIIFLTLLSLTAHAKSPLDQLTFLQGCWGNKNEQGQKISEDWFQQRNTTMLGVSQTLAPDNTMVEYEFIEIKYDSGSQQITYTPTLNGKRLNTFTAKGFGENEVTFSDSKNPTLKHIHYHLKLKSVLSIRLMGNGRNGNPFDFSYDLKAEDCNSRHK